MFSQQGLTELKELPVYPGPNQNNNATFITGISHILEQKQHFALHEVPILMFKHHPT